MRFRYRPCLSRLAATAAILAANPACDEPTRRTPDGGAPTASAGTDVTSVTGPQRGWGSNAGTGSSAGSAVTATLDLLSPAISASTFRTDILAYRSRLAGFPNASTFYPDTTTHTFIAFEEFYSTTAGGVRLVDWFAKIANGQSPGHAGP